MIKKIRKAIIAIGTFFVMLPIKVFGSIFSNDLLESGNNFETLYGAVMIEPEEIANEIIWTILKIILIPIILLIGCIVFLTKSKRSEKTKIVIGLVLIISAIVLLIESYYYYA